MCACSLVLLSFSWSAVLWSVCPRFMCVGEILKKLKNNSMLQSLCVYISGAELEVVRRLFFYPLSVNEQIYTDKWCIVIAYVK